MPDPKREMFSDEMVEAMERLHQYPRLIAERAAAEAVAAERARIRAAVKAAPLYGGWTREDDVPHYVDVEYVFDAIDDA